MMRSILKIAALALCLVVAVGCFAPTLADFGDFDTGGDYGGDFDSDYGSSGGSGGSLLGTLASILILAILSPIIKLVNKAKDAKQDRAYREAMEDVSSLKQLDPGYDWDSLSAWVRSLYTRMQADWEKGDISELKDEFTPECWSRFDTQLQTKLKQGYQGHVRDIRFLSIRTTGWCTRESVTYLDIALETSIVSWNTNSNGVLTTGDTYSPKTMSYLWRVQRPSDARTDPNPVPCPACGRNNLRIMSRCGGCNAVLERDPDAWKLYDISGMPKHMQNQ